MGFKPRICGLNGCSFSCICCSDLTKVKVIDMTGPQQRVLSGYHAISGPQRPADEWEHRKDKKFSNFALPELQHNLNLLVDLCEQVCFVFEEAFKKINNVFRYMFFFNYFFILKIRTLLEMTVSYGWRKTVWFI